MEVLAGCRVQSPDLAAPWPALGAALLGLWIATGASAQEVPAVPTDLVDAAPAGARGRIEMAATSLPLFENLDGASHSSRLDMIWLPPRRPNLGLALGLTSKEGAGLRLPGSGAAPAVDLGLHWRYTLDTQYRIDVTAWRRMTPPDAAMLAHERQAAYGARFEMQIKSLPSRRLVADRGFLGLQLESGARITVKRRHGGPMFYYRAKF
ncbi:hypothetical protein RAMLITH_03645 [Ramlibacter sp. RBP-2]|uniref:Uncharacterized protein n=1 Tax=Ramlibacter lithotrophicus TaxID=2606681 RepID=A0A7X6DCY7_9BURK|nr:hypothetical protein [Ramlibacter lithotrophicus]NKE64904.1 hypothetical protein [Ramlibacter lithotrophicus]